MPFARISQVKGAGKTSGSGSRRAFLTRPPGTECAWHPHISLHRAHDLVDAHAQRAWLEPWSRPRAKHNGWRTWGKGEAERFP